MQTTSSPFVLLGSNRDLANGQHNDYQAGSGIHQCSQLVPTQQSTAGHRIAVRPAQGNLQQQHPNTAYSSQSQDLLKAVVFGVYESSSESLERLWDRFLDTAMPHNDEISHACDVRFNMSRSGNHWVSKAVLANDSDAREEACVICRRCHRRVKTARHLSLGTADDWVGISRGPKGSRKGQQNALPLLSCRNTKGRRRSCFRPSQGCLLTHQVPKGSTSDSVASSLC